MIAISVRMELSSNGRRIPITEANLFTSDIKQLFNLGGSLTDFLRQLEVTVRREIDDMDRDYILKASCSDLIEALVSKHELSMPKLVEDKIHIWTEGETEVDVSQDRGRHIFDRNQPFFMKATYVAIVVPFEGDGRVFDYVPPMRTTTRPMGHVSGQRIILYYEQVESSHEQLQQRYNSDLSQIKQYLGYSEGCVAGFNQGLTPRIKQMVDHRKQWLLSSRDMVSSLGIPMMERADAPKTYTVPDVRRKPQVSMPDVPTGAFKPEPTLSTEDYEHILGVINNMVLVMEKSPGAFVTMKEESLRSHFLVQLNGQYEGQAAGETFNFKGKTDILMSHKGRNIFIAECKFWEGEKSLLGAIDQLLGYTSWRDTKTAILLFSKRKNFSTVVDKIDAVVKAHYDCKESIGKTGDSSFRYVFGHHDDPNRELLLTVLAFHIPS